MAPSRKPRVPESSSSRPARSRALSAARARLPPRLTRLTPSEKSVGAWMTFAQPGHEVERGRDGRGEPADGVLVVHARHEDAVGSGFDVARLRARRSRRTRRRSQPPNQVSVRALSTNVPGGRGGPRGGDPVHRLVDAEQDAADLVLEVAARPRPTSTARRTVAATSPYPASRSAVTGTPTAATIRPTCSSIVSRSSAPPSGTPRDQAMPALVVAMAGKPTCSRIRAEPASQALGITKPGP